MCEGLGIALIFDVGTFSRKYALIYTTIVAFLLITPLIAYIILLLQIDKAKTELSLERHAKQIIVAMQRHNNTNKVFRFPRSTQYNAALYDVQFRTIFSTLPFTPLYYTAGFHQEKKYYYFVYEFLDDYYFGATYLVVAMPYTATKIYLFALSMFALILSVLFLLSLLLLRHFSAPFEALNRHLDNFIKDAMHEINTPLSIINLNIDLFSQKNGESKYLNRIKAASKTLSTIYDDMEYLVKQGRVEHTPKSIEMGEFIQNRIDYFREVARMKQLDLSSEIQVGVLYTFSTKKLQRIVDNTLSNAIKYSHDNGIVKIKLEASETSIRFWVQDYGAGIKDTERIFSRYYRENESKGGFGIGLSIVKQIIDEAGIELDVSSSPNQGTLFTYTFHKNK